MTAGFNSFESTAAVVSRSTYSTGSLISADVPLNRIGGQRFRERFLAWAIRKLLLPDMPAHDTARVIKEAFRLARIGEAFRPFLGFMNAVASATRGRALDLRRGPVLGHDEWRLLQTLGAMQEHDLPLAVNHLRSFMHPEAARHVMTHAIVPASALNAAGWILQPLPRYMMTTSIPKHLLQRAYTPVPLRPLH